jgi:hypothetical protein
MTRQAKLGSRLSLDATPRTIHRFDSTNSVNCVV